MVLLVLYYLVRLLGLAIATVLGYVIVYVPLMCLLDYLMDLFGDKQLFVLIIPIIGISIYAAYRMAKLADSRLPRSTRPEKSNPELGNPSSQPVNERILTG